MASLSFLLRQLNLSRKSWLTLLVYFPLTIAAALLACWVYLSTERISNLISIKEASEMHFDFIIVGAGTAGCVLANRLSEIPGKTVLLIEAGSTFSPLAMVPLLASQQQKSSVDWQLETIPQKYSSIGCNKQIQFLPRGKGLGGSSQINYLLHFDGNAKDFERWKSHGAEHWNFTELKTNLRPMSIPYGYSILSKSMVDATMELRNNKLSQVEYELAKYNVQNGLRHSAFHSYLRPCFDRSNLKILMNTRVHRVRFVNKKAVGVVITDDSFEQPQRIIHAKEIILSAGSFHTPQILKLSGIGPGKELNRFKIPVVVNSTTVGRNLYDHISLPLYVTVNVSASITRSKILNSREFLNYMLHGQGALANFGVIGYLGEQKMDHSVGIFGVGSIDEQMLRKITNTEKETFRKNFPFFNVTNQEGFVLLNLCTQPLSRGSVRLQSIHIRNPPIIDPNYFANKKDILCTMQAIRLSMDLMETKAFRQMGAVIRWPQFDQCKNFMGDIELNGVNDRYLECIIRVGAVTAHHPGGSCAIGKTSKSCIDSRMRVRGVKRLRVIDASTIPSPVNGLPHTSVVAIAERAAQMIHQETHPK